MYKIVAVWSGWSGAPGFSNFYFGAEPDAASANSAAERVRAFFAFISFNLPSVVQINIAPTYQVIDPSSGVIQSEVPLTDLPDALQGTGGAGFSAPSGACVVWRTGATVGGRLLKGKTFVVPMAKDAYDVDGTIAANRLAELRSGATALATGGGAGEDNSLGVWHRPVAGAGGSWAATLSATVSDRAAILRSRRQ